MAFTQSVSFRDKIIETTVTAKASIAENWLLRIRSICEAKTTVVGINCKWKPHPISSMSGKIVTMQLCIDTKCLVLKLLHMDSIPQSLKNFLTDSNIVFTGIDMEETQRKLGNEYGFWFAKKIDVRSLVKLHYPLSFCGKPGLKAIASRLLQLHGWKPKNLCVSNLECRVLGAELIKFACIDAYVCYRIGKKLIVEAK